MKTTFQPISVVLIFSLFLAVISCAYAPFNYQVIVNQERLSQLDKVLQYDQEGTYLSGDNIPLDWFSIYNPQAPGSYLHTFMIGNKFESNRNSYYFNTTKAFEEVYTNPRQWYHEGYTEPIYWPGETGDGLDRLYRRNFFYFGLPETDSYYLAAETDPDQTFAAGGVISMSGNGESYGYNFRDPQINLGVVQAENYDAYEDNSDVPTVYSVPKVKYRANISIGASLFNYGAELTASSDLINYFESFVESDWNTVSGVGEPPDLTGVTTVVELDSTKVTNNNINLVIHPTDFRYQGGDLVQGKDRSQSVFYFLFSTHVQLFFFNTFDWHSSTETTGRFFFLGSISLSDASDTGFEYSTFKLKYLFKANDDQANQIYLGDEDNLYFNHNGSISTISVKDRISGTNKTLLITESDVVNEAPSLTLHSELEEAFVVDIFSDEKVLLRNMDNYGAIRYQLASNKLEPLHKGFSAGDLRYTGFIPEEGADVAYFSYVRFGRDSRPRDYDFEGTVTFGLYSKSITDLQLIESN